MQITKKEKKYLDTSHTQISAQLGFLCIQDKIKKNNIYLLDVFTFQNM